MNNFFFLIYYIFIDKLFSIFFHYLDYNNEDIEKGNKLSMMIDFLKKFSILREIKIKTKYSS